ncbi:MAG: hypothetical protein HFF61_02450 [Oscillospiraceae bacterium]|nr:hypothetical protein [Oscillospiraceae bacterium]
MRPVLLLLICSLCLTLLGCGGPAASNHAPPEAPSEPPDTGLAADDAGEPVVMPEGPTAPEPFAEDFSDAAFIGDSRTEGLQLHAGLSKADFFTDVGLMVNEALTEDKLPLPDGTRGTALEALSGRTYRRIYLMFGVNELGWDADGVFKDDYAALIQAIQEVQPEAVVYAQTIFPVTREKSEGDRTYNNDNVRRFNDRVREAAEETGAVLIETAALFDDGAGNLPAEVSTDGVHLTHSYYLQWLDYLREVSVP